jgi:glycyl-tRNA synthetase (class II)
MGMGCVIVVINGPGATRVAPYKAAVPPLLMQPELIVIAKDLYECLVSELDATINNDKTQSIG